MIKYALLISLLSIHSLFACVTYDRSTGTYTIDKSGCISQPSKEKIEYTQPEEISE